MKTVLIWMWCFPQMLVGLIVKIATKARKKDGCYHYDLERGSVSLGEYIFLCPQHWNDKAVLKHERGHRKQSLILGWLYLFVIALPSIIWAGCFNGYRRRKGVSYYAFYTERWANKLGGLDKEDAE